MSLHRDPVTDQRLPTRTEESQDVFAAIITELGPTATDTHLKHAMLARAVHGRNKYGDTLHSHNGRDALLDAWEEAMDLMAYCKQLELEGESSPFKEAKLMARRLTWKRIKRGDWDTVPRG